MRERKLHQEPPFPTRALRQPRKPAKIRASRKPKRLQPKRQKIQRQKGLSISYYHEYHLWSLLTLEGKTTPIEAAKPPHKDRAQEPAQSISPPQYTFIKDWISACAQIAEREDSLQNPLVDMPQSARMFISGRESTNRSKASVSHQANFRHLQEEYNILTERENPPTKVSERALEIISPANSSFEMDDATVEELKDDILKVAHKGEDEFIQKIVPRLIPAMNDFPDENLAAERNRTWDNSVAVPLDPVPLEIPHKLPRPRPDLVFGYSPAAFDRNQRMAMGSLVNKVKQSYAKPRKTLAFPFLQVEHKARSTFGILYVAESQVAGGGAIAMNGLLELYRRISADTDIDMDIPQYFSLTLDQKFASLHVHWLSKNAENGAVVFNMRSISTYWLESDDLKKLDQAVKNILDYGLRERLPKIREALDKYYQKIVPDREKAIRRRKSSPEPRAEGQQIRGRQLDDPVDQSPAQRRRLGRPPREDTEEGSVEGPAELLQRRGAARARTNMGPPSIRQKEKRRRRAPSAKPVRRSSRIAELAQSLPREQDP